jgi:acyl-CoA synthetase (AMP-forming)/AMP-acid ligase II
MERTDTATRTGPFASLPDRRAASDPGGACLDDDRITLTNAEFFERVQAAAALFAAHGVGAGDVVATLLANRTELVVAMFAAWRLGAALTPVNPSLTAGEAAFQIQDAGARLLVHAGDGENLADVDSIDVDSLPSVVVGEAARPVSHDPSALALLIYTSGTTGTPKGVMLDHANLVAMVDTIVDATALSRDARCLLILPLFHVNGIVVSVLAPLAAGGVTSISARFSAPTFFDTVEALRPTYFSAVPAIYAMLTALPDDLVPDTSSIEFAICGAAPMPAELIHRFEARYGIPIIEGYGLSECTCACTLNPIDAPRKPGTVGRPLPGIDVALLGDDGRPTHNGTGEVLVRGANVMRGYLNRPSETADALRDGWLHTGDVGHFDEDGYLVLVDRVKDMIIRGGENIYPKEIENVLYRHSAVLEAAVVGRPHDVLGEEPVAFIVLRSETTTVQDELRALCTAELAAYKRPREIIVMDTLPKNPVGKISKPALRDTLSGVSG